MILKENINCVAFLGKVKECAGEVRFETAEGDVLNLKSTLSQYLFATMTDSHKFLSHGSVVCDEESDYQLLGQYLF